MNYQTVFDITTSGYKSWSFPGHGLIFIVIGFFLFLARNNLPGWWGRHPKASKIFACFYFCFALIWTITSFFATYGEYCSLSSAVKDGRAQVIEGMASNFKPMPASGHAIEHFCVENKCFGYSDYVISGGFNNTSANGGPIKEGLPVKVTFFGNAIVKLEVSQ